VNEFHNAPNAFFFTSPLNSTVLPTLRVSGEGVLTEFGFNVGRVRSDVLMVVLIGAHYVPKTSLSGGFIAMCHTTHETVLRWLCN